MWKNSNCFSKWSFWVRGHDDRLWQSHCKILLFLPFQFSLFYTLNIIPNSLILYCPLPPSFSWWVWVFLFFTLLFTCFLFSAVHYLLHFFIAFCLFFNNTSFFCKKNEFIAVLCSRMLILHWFSLDACCIVDHGIVCIALRSNQLLSHCSISFFL